MVYTRHRYIPKYQNGSILKGYLPHTRDEGYYYNDKWTKAGDLVLKGRVLPRGIVAIGSGALGGDRYDPVSDQAINDFFDDMATFNRYDDRFRQLGTHRALVLQEKDPMRRLRMMDQIQGDRQGVMWDNFSDQLKYSAINYAPTRSGLQYILDNLKGQEKKDFKKELRNLGWGIRGNKVTRGSYGFQSDPKATTVLAARYLSKPGNKKLLYDYTKAQTFDKRWHVRRENIETPDFYSEADYNKYLADNRLKEINGKFVQEDGAHNYADPRLFRTKIVDEDTYKAWAAKPKDLDDYTLEEGSKNKYIRYITQAMVDENDKKPVEDNPAANTESEVKAQSPKREEGSFLDAFPLLPPQSARIPPQVFQPGLKTIGHYQANPIATSAESSIRDLDRQYSTTSRLAAETNPYTSSALQSNLFAQRASAVNQAQAAANLTNLQDTRQVENLNEQRMLARDQYNQQSKQLYEDKANQTLDNYVKSWRGYYDTLNLDRVNKYNLTNQHLMLNAMNQDIRIGPFGNIRQVSDPNFYTTGSVMNDVRTGKTYIKDSNGNLREVGLQEKVVETSPKKKRYGGFLRNGGRFKLIF